MKQSSNKKDLMLVIAILLIGFLLGGVINGRAVRTINSGSDSYGQSGSGLIMETVYFRFDNGFGGGDPTQKFSSIVRDANNQNVGTVSIDYRYTCAGAHVVSSRVNLTLGVMYKGHITAADHSACSGGFSGLLSGTIFLTSLDGSSIIQGSVESLKESYITVYGSKITKV